MNINKILVVILIFISAIGSSGCSDDRMDEITSLDFGRFFSPTGLGAAIVNKTGVLLSWEQVKNAQSYSIEIFENPDFTGSPVKSVEGIAYSQSPYTITGLDFGTKYYVRVKASGEDKDTSKWAFATFTTDQEQIFQDVNQDKLTGTSVTLNWPAGQIATSIEIMPGNIIHQVTSEEIAAGEATISGLAKKNTYTATLKNGNKIRGTKTFTTIDAIFVAPGDNLSELIANAASGDTFVLTPGEHIINSDITVSRTITLKGSKATDRPRVKGMVIRLRGNAGLTLKDIILDGTGALNSNQAIMYDEALSSAYAPLTVQNCEIKNYVKGVMYVNVKALIETVTFKENIIHHIECSGGDFIDFRTGLARIFLFENNTVYSSAADRDLFRMDPGGSTNFPDEKSIVTIRTNTFNSVSVGSSRRFLYIRLASHQIYFTKNLIANTNGYYTNQPTTTFTTRSDNNYYNAPNFMQSAVSGANNDTGAFTTLDPLFVNASQGDFTLGNSNLKAAGVGDSRWR